MDDNGNDNVEWWQQQWSHDNGLPQKKPVCCDNDNDNNNHDNDDDDDDYDDADDDIYDNPDDSYNSV